MNNSNVAVDMIKACIAHYKTYGRRVSVITLNSSYWRIFCEWCKRNRPEFVFDNAIQFQNIRIEKGSQFMTDRMHVELETVKAEA
jgi:hypothetical protein